MNQKELLQTLADRTHLPKSAILSVLRTTADVAAEALTDGREGALTLPGLGKLVARRSASRRLKILGTDEYRIVGGHRRAKFLPSGAFRESVRGELP
jgi:nucleoid DNA-binding protein